MSTLTVSAEGLVMIKYSVLPSTVQPSAKYQVFDVEVVHEAMALPAGWRARCSTIPSPPSSSTIVDTNAAFITASTSMTRLSRAGTVMLCVIGAWPSEPKKLIRPVTGSSDGLVTVTSPPTVGSDAGTPGQYHVLVIFDVCVAYGRLAVGVGEKVAAVPAAVCCAATTLATNPARTATTINVRRMVMPALRLRRRPMPSRPATAAPPDRPARDRAAGLRRSLDRGGADDATSPNALVP